MQGFQGHGYSIEFSKNMEYIINFLKANPEQKIEIIAECDAICSYCPCNKNEICKNAISNWKIRQIDKKVIKKLKIDYCTIISAEEIISITNQIFKTRKDIEGICGDCKWKEKCLWYLSKNE
jgi:hypothetical protein